MANKPPGTWPKRPPGFYDDWSAFCLHALSARLSDNSSDDAIAVALLSGGAVLGAGALVAMVQSNKKVIDAKGKEWGFENLSTLVVGGGTLLGAALGGFGTALLSRTLAKHANERAVNALQSRLVNARREFESLKRLLAAKQLTGPQHQAAVERLFAELQATA